jgi:class 3 adenylate cyclase/tetratricopeptide (TPR) repeat protein
VSLAPSDRSHAAPDLAPFVHPLALERIRRDPWPPSGCETTTAAGAVLLADVAGFTRLTEACVEKGPAGVEDVRDLLNAHFSPIVESVASCGGRLLHFAGDAAIAWFPAESPASVGAAADRAACCARQILEAPGGSHRTLPVRIGMGAGQAYTALVGGTGGQWECVLAGPALESAISALDTASAGTAATAPGWPSTTDPPPLPRAAPIGDGRLSAAAETALRAFVPPALLARLDAGQVEWLGEFRQVTVLFVGVAGVDFGDGIDRAQVLTEVLQQAIAAEAGTMLQFVVDDKTTTVLAVWGLALHTHEDDAVRAVRAAMRIHAELGPLGWTMRAGIASGRAFAGARGTEARRDYAVIGDVVNLAARLRDLADDRVITDAATRAAARRSIVFEALPPTPVKGRSLPVAVFRPLREKRRLARDQKELIGRGRERDVLFDALKRVTAGRMTEVLLVEGEPGIGKTRLIAALLERASTSSLRGIVAAGDSLERASALHPWRAVVAGVLGHDESDPAVARERLPRLLESEPSLGGYAPLLNGLLALGVPDTPESLALTAEGRGERTRDLVVHLIRGLAPEGAVVVLEDAHWFDSASWALVETLMASVQPLLVVVVSRPTMAVDLPDEAKRVLARVGTTLKLEPLAADDIVALACQRLDVDGMPAAVAALIRSRSEGHPLFAGELAVALRDRGLIRVENGDTVLAVDEATLQAQALPATVEGIVTSRLDRLPAPHQITIKVASVLGRSFTLEALAAVHPLAADAARLEDDLLEIVELDLLQVGSEAAGRVYRFSHAIVEQVAYGLLPFAQRRQLHQAVGEWIERRQTTIGEARVAILAHHWLRAEHTSKALHYLRQAGQQALDRDHNQEAVTFFSEAIALIERSAEPLSDVQRAGWHKQLGEAYFQLARLPGAIEHLERALALVGVAGPATPAGRARAFAREALVQAWHIARRPRPDPVVRERAVVAASAASLLAWVHMVRRDSSRLMLQSLIAVNQAERGGAPSVFARGMLGVMATALGLHTLGRRYFDRSHAEWYDTKPVRELSLAALYDAMDRIGAGHQAGAFEILEEALRFAREGQARVPIARLLSVTSLFHGLVGRMTEAHRFGQAAIDSLPEGPCHERVHVYSGSFGAEILTLRGAAGLERIAPLEPMLRSLIEPDDRFATMGVGTLRAMALFRAGRFDEALAAAAEVHAVLVSDLRTTITAQWMTLFVLGDVFIHAWDRRAGASRAGEEKRARGFVRWFTGFARRHPVFAPHADILNGRIAELTGSLSGAHRLWRRAIERAQTLGLIADEARARAELGRTLPAGDERRQMLTVAHALYTSGGMPHEADRVQEALGDVGYTRAL